MRSSQKSSKKSVQIYDTIVKSKTSKAFNYEEQLAEKSHGTTKKIKKLGSPDSEKTESPLFKVEDVDDINSIVGSKKRQSRGRS